MMNVMLDGDDDEDGEELEFAVANPVRRRDPRWVSVRDILVLEQPDALTDIADSLAVQIPLPEGVTDHRVLFSRVHKRLLRLWDVRNRFVPVVKIDHEPEDVAEVFARVNQEGTRVSEADVVLALVAVHNPGWVREQYNPFRTQLADAGWALDAGIFVRTVAGIGAQRCRLREIPESFYTADSFSQAWSVGQQAMGEVIHRVAQFGLLNVDLLPSANSLIPLFVLHAVWGGKPGYRFEHALHWLLMANRDGRYGGSAMTRLDQDVRSIHSASGLEEALSALYSRLHTPEDIDPNEFLERYDRAGARFQRLLLYLMLFGRDAHDWVDGIRLGYDKTGGALVHGFRPNYHHIFAQSLLRKAGAPRSEDDINVLANITVLNELTNCAALGNKTPAEYISEFHIPRGSLEAHLVPSPFVEACAGSEDLVTAWDLSRYDDFITARADLLAQEANLFLRSLQG